MYCRICDATIHKSRSRNLYKGGLYLLVGRQVDSKKSISVPLVCFGSSSQQHHRRLAVAF